MEKPPAAVNSLFTDFTIVMSIPVAIAIFLITLFLIINCCRFEPFSPLVKIINCQLLTRPNVTLTLILCIILKETENIFWTDLVAKINFFIVMHHIF